MDIDQVILLLRSRHSIPIDLKTLTNIAMSWQFHIKKPTIPMNPTLIRKTQSNVVMPSLALDPLREFGGDGSHCMENISIELFKSKMTSN